MKGGRTLNLFTSLPRDLTEATYSGACLSLLCSIVIIFLVISETMSYLTY